MKRSGLFALEREVRGHRAAARAASAPARSAAPRPAAERTAAFGFDGGEALELLYDPAYHAVTGEPAPPRTAAFTAELHDGALSYFVEPFEDDEPSRAASAPSPKPEPVDAVWAEAASLPAPAAEAQDDDLHRALEADLRSLLGQALSAPEAAAEPATPPPAPRREEPRAPEPAPAPVLEDRHAVFDQVGRALAFATTFNLPPVSLEQRFDDFDRVLEREETVRETVRAQKAQAAQTPPAAAALSLDAETLMNDLRMLGGGDFGAQRAPRPAVPAEPFAAEPAAALAVADAPEQPGPASFAAGPQSFHVSYDVPLVPQQTDMSCWAAGAAMVLAWRDDASVDPGAIGRAVGYVKQYQHGLPADDTRVLTAWGFTPEHAQTYTVEGFRALLERHGPLWVASAEPGPHIRVVTGLSGDGTPDGTRVHINDPWERGMDPFRLPNAGAQYQETYREFEEKQRRLALKELHLQGIYVAHL
ncbi:MAG TPA: papain-like cysteine protease family protein [Longimicrobium sp.]